MAISILGYSALANELLDGFWQVIICTKTAQKNTQGQTDIRVPRVSAKCSSSSSKAGLTPPHALAKAATPVAPQPGRLLSATIQHLIEHDMAI
jgi:hypothetical protein